jgi:hypothetical protein
VAVLIAARSYLQNILNAGWFFRATAFRFAEALWSGAATWLKISLYFYRVATKEVTPKLVKFNLDISVKN